MQEDDAAHRSVHQVLSYLLLQKKNRYLLEEEVVLLRFSADGAKLAKKIDSVRGVLKLLPPRNMLQKVSFKPVDEVTLFFFRGRLRTFTKI